MKMRHPDGGTIETRPDYVEMYESQGWEKVTTPAKKATPAKPSSTTDAETK